MALLSFLPMAVSWIWILGIMALCHIQFNVVNIILATFIFGQGDDYTIFMTEGCQYEYAYGRRMLASYRQSIILSALIMFIGIGSLIFAKHPALHSLAEVTIVGMFAVVLTAYLLPPMIFRWLVCDINGYRRRPLTLRSLLTRQDEHDYIGLVSDRYRYRGIEVYSAVRRGLRRLRQHPEQLEHLSTGGPIVVKDCGWGERALVIALMYPDCDVYAEVADEEHAVVCSRCAEGIAPRLKAIKMKNEK